MTEVEKKVRDVIDGLYGELSTVPRASQGDIDHLFYTIDQYWGSGHQPATMWPIGTIAALALEACQARREKQAAGGEQCPSEKDSATSSGPS